MNLRQLALATGIAATASLIAGVTAAPAATKVTCATKGSTLAAGPSARVFTAGSGSARRVYGCSTSANKPRNLGRPGGEGVDTSVVAVSGARVAYVITSCSDTGCQQSVLVRNLKTNTAVSAALAAPGDVDQKVTDVVLSKAGTVGWISEERNGTGVATQRYVSTRKPGTFTGIAVVPIATGLDIVAGSLALGGSTMYWTQAGPKSAALG
jgi:hypothetical protein